MSFKFGGNTKIVFKQGALDRLLASEQGPVGKELLRIGVAIEGDAKRLLSNQLVNVVTGRLRSSTTHVLVRRGRGLSLFVGSGASYAIEVHKGRPYLTIAAEKVTGRRIS